MPSTVFPTINASLNLIAAIFLLLGYRAIKEKKQLVHRRYMIMALCASALFLISYVSYHAMVGTVTRYEGEGILRVLYFFILLTHTPLAVLILPFVVASVYLAVKGNYAAHTKITRWLWPVWMYVSLTGVAIYLMLYVF